MQVYMFGWLTVSLLLLTAWNDDKFLAFLSERFFFSASIVKINWFYTGDRLDQYLFIFYSIISYILWQACMLSANPKLQYPFCTSLLFPPCFFAIWTHLIRPSLLFFPLFGVKSWTVLKMYALWVTRTYSMSSMECHSCNHCMD